MLSYDYKKLQTKDKVWEEGVNMKEEDYKKLICNLVSNINDIGVLKKIYTVVKTFIK
jgi:hypothetical protein